MSLTNFTYGTNYHQALGVGNTTPAPKTSGFMSALGIAAPVLGSLIGNIGRKKREREAREYNSPAAQMARLQEAGLNPNLIYGSSPSGAAGTGQAPDYEMKVGSQDILNTQTMRQITAQTQNIKAQTRLADMTAAATGARIPGLEAESRYAGAQALSGLAYQRAQTDYVKEQARSAMVDANIKSRTEQDQVERIILDSQLMNLNKTGKEYQNEIDKVKADLAEKNLTLNDNILARIIDLLIPDNFDFRNIFNKPKG